MPCSLKLGDSSLETKTEVLETEVLETEALETEAWRLEACLSYLNDALHLCLVGGDLGLLQDTDSGADPRHENKLGAFAELISRLKPHEAVNSIIVCRPRCEKGSEAVHKQKLTSKKV